MNPIVSTLIKGMLYFILKAKQGGKYLDRKRVVDKKTGKMVWGNYKYKPMQQRAAHEVTRNKFEKVTKLSGDEHKNQIEHALQNGIHVSLHVLRDYPDLAVKYHQQARLAKADKIRAKVKTHKEKERMEREVRLNTPEGLKNNPIKLEAERMMREDGLIKDVPVSDNREVENNFDTMPESKPEAVTPAKSPEAKANFEAWKEERKQAPAFKLEADDLTSTEKLNRFNDKQGGLFGKKPVTHESYAKKDFKPSLALEGIESIDSLIVNVRNALLKEGLDTKAREFIDNAYKTGNLEKIKKLASEYVDIKEPAKKETIKLPDEKGGLYFMDNEFGGRTTLKIMPNLKDNEFGVQVTVRAKMKDGTERIQNKPIKFYPKEDFEKFLADVKERGGQHESERKKMASEYVDMKESSQVSNPSTENKGSEEKKMETMTEQQKQVLQKFDYTVKNENGKITFYNKKGDIAGTIINGVLRQNFTGKKNNMGSVAQYEIGTAFNIPKSNWK